jgi:hypothetical protein
MWVLLPLESKVTCSVCCDTCLSFGLLFRTSVFKLPRLPNDDGSSCSILSLATSSSKEKQLPSDAGSASSLFSLTSNRTRLRMLPKEVGRDFKVLRDNDIRSSRTRSPTSSGSMLSWLESRTSTLSERSLPNVEGSLCNEFSASIFQDRHPESETKSSCRWRRESEGNSSPVSGG